MKTANILSWVFVGMVLTYLTVLTTLALKHDNSYIIDLPEEISQATSNDTLIAIKQGDIIKIEFKNK